VQGLDLNRGQRFFHNRKYHNLQLLKKSSAQLYFAFSAFSLTSYAPIMLRDLMRLKVAALIGLFEANSDLLLLGFPKAVEFGLDLC
jgi:hypothetical protein